MPFSDMSPASTPQPYTWITQYPEELPRIFDVDTQVACWQRHPDPTITTYLQQAATSDILNSGFRVALQAGQQLDPALLPDKPGRNALVSDICMLSTLYHDLLGCPAIGLRIEILRHAMCPRFHVDRTGIRMTCTYLGPGTEWIDDVRIDRARLGPGANGLPDMESGLFMDETPPIEAASFFDVVLLKGTLWQGNGIRGAVHRSPVIASDNPRILLVMDALWD